MYDQGSSTHLHEMVRAVRDKEELLVCIHKPFEEPAHVWSFFDVFFHVLAYNFMHHGMARTDCVLK